MQRDLKTTLRRWSKAQSTVLNWLTGMGKAYGYYVPYSYVEDLRNRDQNYIFQWLFDKWEQDSSEFLSWIDCARQHNDLFKSWQRENPQDPHGPRFDQDWFPGLDGAMAYSIVRKIKPSKIIEIGSGHSTRFLAKAINDGGLTTHLHSIDPVPRREIDKLCAQVTRKTVDKVAVTEIIQLRARDILFIDASHLLMPGTDVDILFHEVIPQLPAGVFIHIHDIFLPFEYPDEWRWRNYNEQHALLGLLAGGRLKTLTAHHYFRRHHPEWLKGLDINPPKGAKEASIWLEIT